MHFTFWRLTNWYNSDRCIPSRDSYSLRDHLTHRLYPLAHIHRNCRDWVICSIYLLLHRHHLCPFPHYRTSYSHSANRAGLPAPMIPTVPAYTLHTPSPFPTAANLLGSYVGVGRGFGTRARGHASQPSITLTQDDDDKHSECKRARMEGAVGIEGNSNAGIGVAGSGEQDGYDNRLGGGFQAPHVGVGFWRGWGSVW